MNQTKFYLLLIITAVVSLLISLFAVKSGNVDQINKASYLLISFFVVFSILIFIFSNQAIKSANPYLFTRVFMVSIAVKFLILAIIVLLFVKIMVIPPKELVTPLISCYLLFTIFETYVLMKIAKVK